MTRKMMNNGKQNTILIVSIPFLIIYIFYTLTFARLYGGSDEFYYAAQAQSFIENGSLLDYTGIPESLPITVQNGTSFMHIFLLSIGIISLDVRINILFIMNILLFYFGLIVLLKLIKFTLPKIKNYFFNHFHNYF